MTTLTFLFTDIEGSTQLWERAPDDMKSALQRDLDAERWPDVTPIRVRVGVHSGDVEQRDGDYFGPTVNRTARLMAIAHGGQVVCSGVTAALLDGNVAAPLVDSASTACATCRHRSRCSRSGTKRSHRCGRSTPCPRTCRRP